MTKSELIEAIAAKTGQLSSKDVELAVKTILEHMSQALSAGERIEIRGFGSFSLHYREPRRGRNPKTGDSVELTGKYVPHFKPGKELRERHQRLNRRIEGPVVPEQHSSFAVCLVFPIPYSIPSLFRDGTIELRCISMCDAMSASHSFRFATAVSIAIWIARTVINFLLTY